MLKRNVQLSEASVCRIWPGSTEQMANAVKIPVAREMPENMKEKLDIYLARKREKK